MFWILARLASVDLTGQVHYQVGMGKDPQGFATYAAGQGIVLHLVEGFDRRGTEPFELFRPEFAQHSVKIQEFSLENSKISGIFNIF